jgi:hypothetical protein
MRLLTFCCLLLTLLTSQVHAAINPILEILEENGDRKSQYNLVFLADGYTASEQALFKTDVTFALSKLFNETPFIEYRKLFNIYMISATSNESGATIIENNVTTVNKDTAFKSTFHNGRRLYSNEYQFIFNTVQSVLPEYTKIIMLVNSTKYGGTAVAGISYTSKDPLAPDIIKHELGHAIAGLADEYVEAGRSGYEYPNSTANLTNLPWAKWANTTQIPTPEPAITTANNAVNPIGAYQGAMSAEYYRPSNRSKMRQLNNPFCSVGIETFILGIYRSVGLCGGFSPDASRATQPLYLRNYTPVTAAIKENKIFSVLDIKKPATPYKISWTVNNIPQAETTENFNVNSAELGDGLHMISVLLEDVSPLIRNDPQKRAQQTNNWTYKLSNQPAFLKDFTSITSTTGIVTGSFSGTGIRSLTCSDPTVQINLTNKTFRKTYTTSGNNTLSFTASNSFGSDTKTVQILVNLPPQIIPITATFTELTQKSLLLETNEPATITTTNLPTGLSLTNNTLSGKPTTPGEFQIILTAQNTNGSSTYTLPITITALPDFSLQGDDLEIKKETPFNLAITNSFPATLVATSLPAGTNLTNNILSGNINQSGTYSYRITATDAYGRIRQITKTILVYEEPAFLTSATNAVLETGESYKQALTTNYTPTYNITGLPTGITLQNGSLVGTSTETGVFPVQINASTKYGVVSQNFSIKITPPFQISSSKVEAKENSSVEIPINTTLPATLTATLPTGLTLTNGKIQGAIANPGTYNYSVTAQDEDGRRKTLTNSIFIYETPKFTEPPTTTASSGELYVQTLRTNYPATYSVTGMPSGITLQNGNYVGVPTENGTYSVNITAFTKYGEATLAYTLTVSPLAEITVETPAIQIFRTEFFTKSFTANIPYTVTPIELPQGLTITNNQLSGTLRETGTYFAKLRFSGTYNRTVDKVIEIIVNLDLQLSPITVEKGKGTFLKIPLVANKPVLWSADFLPPGLKLNPTGELTGNITSPGTYSIALTANTGVETKQTTCTINILPNPDPLEVSAAPTPKSMLGTGVNLPLTTNQPASFTVLNSKEFYIENGTLKGNPKRLGIQKINIEIKTETENKIVVMTIDTSMEATSYQSVYETESFRSLITLTIQKTGAFSVVIPTETKRETIRGQLSATGSFQNNLISIQINSTNATLIYESTEHTLKKAIANTEITALVGNYNYAINTKYGRGTIFRTKYLMGTIRNANKRDSVASLILADKSFFIASNNTEEANSLTLNSIASSESEEKQCEQVKSKPTQEDRDYYTKQLNAVTNVQSLNLLSNGTFMGTIVNSEGTFRIEGIVFNNVKTLIGIQTNRTNKEVRSFSLVP